MASSLSRRLLLPVAADLHRPGRLVHLPAAYRRPIPGLRADPAVGRCPLCRAVPGHRSWGSGQAPITLAAGQQLTGVTFSAPNGALLQIRVNDPGQVLPQALPANGPSTLEPQLQIVVKGPDLRAHHAQFVSKDSGGRSYQMVVPLNTALGLTITSSVASALDSSGSLVQAQIGLQATAAAALSPMTFTLQGKGN
jgi:hypothetical protein